MTFDRLRRIADTVLFEGYVLYPYRASAPKNRIRFQFGVLGPRASGDDASWMETRCLVEAAGAGRLDGKLRFLHLRRRTIEKAVSGDAFAPASALDVDGRLHVPWDEGEVREIDFTHAFQSANSSEQIASFDVPGGADHEPILTDAGAVAGRICRETRPLTGRIEIGAEPALENPSLLRLRIRVENTTAGDGDLSRSDALCDSLVSAHLMLSVAGGAFVSLLDPPEWARAAAADCRSVRTYPVLAGEPGRRDLVLSSPIILYDHPAIAPESPGDLFDATEIDALLTLRTMLLTDEEKRELRATDDRAAALLDRVDGMSPEVFERLHGAIRDFGPSGSACASVRIGNATMAKGSRVRLRPGARRADAQDMFLDGLVGRVEAVLQDVDGSFHLAVTLEDDPISELHRWHGRYFYFQTDEVEPMPPADLPRRAGP